MEFNLDRYYIEAIKEYSKILDKEPSIIIKEALEDYFAKVEKELLKDNMEKESALTTFSYDEFWDGVDIDD
jgi:hypothetical protein